MSIFFILGESFIGSAKKVSKLLVDNPMQIFITEGLGKIFGFIGNVAIASANACVGYFILINYYEKEIFSPLAPTLVFFHFVKKNNKKKFSCFS